MGTGMNVPFNIKDRRQWSTAILEKSVIALDLNKVDGQTIHQKIACPFPYSMI